MGRSKPNPSIPYHVEKLLSYNRSPDRYVQESKKTTHDTRKRVSRTTRSTVANPPIQSFKDGAWIEPPVVKSHMDMENLPTVSQHIWADKVRAGNTLVSESTFLKMTKLFPGIFGVK
ncbi:hypothetical protein EAF04_010367 [Stromatinia cepivora]|nr:hypothetical protein EAF04_010367 [Stromatinia cepivora]